MQNNTIRIGPQPGPQETFLSTKADIAIYGGSAGGGKSFALLLEPLRHIKNSQFNSVIFRRTSVQIRNPGGLWDESYNLYKMMKAHPRESFLEWQFSSGASLKFAHLEHESNVFDWQGSQIPFIGFDELTHFTEKQFTYMLSRNRSTSGIAGYVRATCNPDADSWLRSWVDWWIDRDGYAIPERSGVIRWFIRQDDKLIWANSKEELIEQFGSECYPKSFTFISSSIYDNKILLEKDPSYIANLKALSRVDRLRLLGGNWNVRATAGSLFQRDWFQIVDNIPQGWMSCVRFWDRAATKPSEENPDPDWTRGLKMYRYPDGTFIVADLKSARDTPGQVENLIKRTAQEDGLSVQIMSQQDPGSAGVSESEHFIKMLLGYNVKTETISRDKITRAKPVSAQTEAGNIKVLRDLTWNDDFFKECENFGEGMKGHDDIVDCLSGAFNQLVMRKATIYDIL